MFYLTEILKSPMNEKNKTLISKTYNTETPPAMNNITSLLRNATKMCPYGSNKNESYFWNEDIEEEMKRKKTKLS